MNRFSIAGAAFGLALVVSVPSFAQAPAPAPAVAPSAPLTPTHIQLARDLIQITGLSGSFDAIYPEFRKETQQLVSSTRPEMLKDSNEVVAALKPEADKKRDEIMTSAAVIFAQKMPEADIKEIVSFFRSPVGQRYNLTRNQALDEIFGVLQPWSVQTSNFLFDRFAEEMRKRGHKL
ncbi:DUF2059 domain-containing protein [Bosea sp. PAMC 26642]|uniref:DUF2059 domain-containing protein n=1 Tax=Bosea sp. (strain PAMC 26642) TaxID=1792307 RepID=UPI00077038FE|nr:DUF2059 domain-containing protein [Bosea sp. PAMC 26642]AMJ59317.1 hypothetical protein AXW83_02490 [Bosea sp. PAMC 26642]